MLKIIFYILFLFSVNSAFANRISLFFENDFPFNTDRYYTNGLGIKYSSEKLDSLSLIKIFSLFKENVLSEISLVQQIYTPKNTSETELLEDDYPYSGLLFFKLNTFGTNENNWFLITDYSIGIIGKSSFAKETQEAIHSVSASSLNPKGWDNQLKNDLILNIDFTLQKVLLDIPLMELHGFGLAGVGTLNNYIGFGLSLQKYFEITPNLAFSINFSDYVNASIYNTKLQGTFLFNPEKALSADKIETFYNTFRFSSFLRIYKVQLIIAYTNLSNQIKSGNKHQYIRFEIGYDL